MIDAEKLYEIEADLDERGGPPPPHFEYRAPAPACRNRPCALRM